MIDDTRSVRGILNLIDNYCSKNAEDKIVVFIDYIQFINCGAGNDKQNVDIITRELKALANRYNISIIGISSLSREGAKRNDTTSFKESGSIEYTADYLIIMYNKEQAKTLSFGEDNNNITLEFLKNRFGCKGQFNLKYYGNYATFIEENADTPIRQGNFVTPDGKILGKHKGIIHYTVGQRKGLGLALGYPAFVLEIRPETDEVVIGTYEESLTHTLRANELNFMSVEDITEPIRVFAKIRYNHKGAWCTVEKTGEDEITCTFDEPIRAVTPGQAVVLYDGEYVLGGGTIL